MVEASDCKFYLDKEIEEFLMNAVRNCYERFVYRAFALYIHCM
jgi:hypothetical protein